MKYSKLLFLQAALYTMIGALSPVPAVLAGDQPLTNRTITCLIIVSLVAGATALKAFLSTTFSDEKEKTENGKNGHAPAPAAPPVQTAPVSAWQTT